MKTRRLFARLRLGAFAFASAGMLLPPSTVTAEDHPTKFDPPAAAAVTPAADVALAPGGVLQGQVCDNQGLPIAGAEVAIWSAGQQVESIRTDAEGHFLVSGLRGGNYTIVVGDSGGLYRLWTENAAPPHAVPRVLIVRSGVVERGQQDGFYRRWPRSTTLAMAAFLGGIIAGGVIGQAHHSGS